ncbi:peptide/nickel transport system ATP-binding protein [Faunimonas pinastri]|uniref:Glutathione import ATP-binding protein GsiA n=1 Tax=Faunimonas pinastri TaxID=1855383 RepID=A0A1H9NDZ9_9HYPH|nr:ABC transporter ATP-binding protein [Faunimonas pinastri]SER33593.1 peptide/nickel transport system ATP-binding protein [Faunimonas pinastri]
MSQMPATPVLSVRDLRTQVATPSGPRTVVDGLSFDLMPGETLCIAGESGSGKSMTALSLMRLLPEPMARVASGSAIFGGRDLMALPEEEMRKIRGDGIAMIFQEPMTSLNPVLTVGKQLTEAILAHRDVGAGEARKTAAEMLRKVRISDPERRLRQYPHELSGGMRQRVMIAMALVCGPKVLIADEPTTALDVTVQAQILGLIRDLQRDFGTSVILITHDMGVVAEMANRVMVMREGRVIENGPVAEIFHAPRQDYTRELLAAVPRLGAMTGREGPMRAGTVEPVAAGRTLTNPAPLVEVSDLTVRFDIKGGLLQRTVQRVHAVEGINFAIRPAETLALVGESGCGKSTTGRALMNLVPWQGDIRIAGRNTAGLTSQTMKPVRRDIQMIFQDPFASLDPRKTVGSLVGEPLAIHELASGREIREKVAWLFERVGLSPEQMSRHPHEFSGGQRQRICIARALSLSPKVIVADESVSALDVSVQARVLDLLQELQDELGISYLFISHDMAVVEQISHRVAVMYLGQIVEIGTRAQVFEDPRHPYTKRLISAVPIADPSRRREHFKQLEGEVPSPLWPAGSGPERVRLTDIGDGHAVALNA